MRKLGIVLICLTLLLVLAGFSGSMLVIDRPEHADVIVALAGETDRRPARALDLMHQHYAPKMVLDVPANARIYGPSVAELAENYVRSLPQSKNISICPIAGLSTKAEARDVARCLPSGVHNILLVTSDFHTRRALSTFSHELPPYHFSVAAAYDPEQFGGEWWLRRQWAKQYFGEWLRLAWWEGVDRWR
jgi:hypothetical protein